MKKCKNCGRICEDSGKFCSDCGTSLADAEILADDFTGQVGEALEQALDDIVPPIENQDGWIRPDETKSDDAGKTASKEPGAEKPDSFFGELEETGRSGRNAAPSVPEAADDGWKTAGVAAGAAAAGMTAFGMTGADGSAEQTAGPDLGSQGTPLQAGGQQGGSRAPEGAGLPARNPQRPDRGRPGPYAQEGNQGAWNGQGAAPGQQPVGSFVRRTQGGPAGPGMRPMTPVRPSPTVQTIRAASRGMIRSPLFILLVLSGIASLAVSIARQLFEAVDLGDLVIVLKNFNVSEEIVNYANQGVSAVDRMGSLAIVPTILGHLPELFLVIGGIILICTASKNQEEMPTAGFTLIKVGLIIEMVFACILVFAMLVGSTALAVSAWISKNTVFLVAAIIVLVVMIVLAMMIIMYYFSLLHTRKVCMKNAVNGEDYGSVSGYAAVICILFAIVGIAGLLFDIVNMKMWGIGADGTGMLVRLLLGIWIFSYRGRMDKVLGE